MTPVLVKQFLGFSSQNPPLEVENFGVGVVYPHFFLKSGMLAVSVTEVQLAPNAGLLLSNGLYFAWLCILPVVCY